MFIQAIYFINKHVIKFIACLLIFINITIDSYANGTVYYFDVNGSTVGFGSPSGSYNVSGSYWTTNSAGTSATTTIPGGSQYAFGSSSSDFAGNTFTINFDIDIDWQGLLINSTSANITFSGTSNAYLSSTQTWTIPSGSTFNMSLAYNGVGLNMNGSALTLLGGGTLNWTTAVGYNVNGSTTINQNGSGMVVNLQAAAGSASQASYTLTQGTLNFATAASANAFNKMLSGENAKFTIAGGTINNTSGASMTLNLNTSSYVLAGSFTFTGTNDLNLGTHAVALTNASTITTTAGTLTIGGVVSGAFALGKAGAGTLTLTGSNTYTGSTSVTAGTLVFQNLYSSTAIDISSGAVLEMNAPTVDLNNTVSTTFTGTGTLRKTGAYELRWGTGAATFNFSSGALIDVVAGRFMGGSNSNEVWTNNIADLNVESGAYFSGVEATVVVDAITGSGEINSGYSGGGGSFTFGADGGSGTFSGVLANGSAARSFTKLGVGTQIFTGTNTQTGTLTISAGTLQIGASGTVGSFATTSITNNATLILDRSDNITFSAVISGTGAVTKNGANTVTLSGANTYTGATSIAAGTLKLGAAGVIPDASAVTVTGILDMNSYSETVGSIAGAGTIDNVSAGGIPTLTCGGNNSHTTFSGIIQNTTGTFALVKSGTGNFTISGNNTFGGSVTISGGSILYQHNNALGSTSTGTTVNSGSSLVLYSGYTYASEPLIINGNGNGATLGVLRLSTTVTTSVSWSGTITLGSDSKIGTDNSTSSLTISNAISGGFALSKEGNGTLILSGTNTYTGITTVNVGILKLNNTAALGTNAAGTTVSSGAALDLNGITYSTTEALTISGTGVSGGGALINTGASASFAGTVTLAADATINTANQITLSSTISPSTYSITKAGTNSLVFTSNTATTNNLAISAGTLSAGSSTINIYGNFTNSGTFTCGMNTVTFNGIATQSIPAVTFNNLTINNTTSPATSAATMAGNITVNGALTMTTGILNTSSYTITLGSSATISETNPSATNPSSYVIGTVTTTRDLLQNVTNTFGGIGVSITETTQVSNSTLVTRQTGTASVGVGNQSILRYFDISPNVDANLNGTMEFSYIDDELNGQNEVNFKLYKSSNAGSTWTKQASSSVNTGSNTLSLSSISSFSRWTASNTSTNPLPVEFVSFSATKETEGTNLTWETAQEINNDYFDIERSHDGINFEKINSIKGRGTTNALSNYSYVDISSNQTLATYYRLKQVDFDNKTEYSNILFVNGSVGHKDFHLFPNPLEEGNKLYACLGDDDEGIIKVSVFDISGKLLQDFLIDNVETGANITLENENLLLKKGLYIIEIKSIHNDYKQKLEVK